MFDTLCSHVRCFLAKSEYKIKGREREKERELFKL